MLPRIVSGLAENTNSIFCDGLRARYSEWMSGSATAGTTAERHICELVVPRHRYCALLKKRASRDVCFLLTNDLHGRRQSGQRAGLVRQVGFSTAMFRAAKPPRRRGTAPAAPIALSQCR